MFNTESKIESITGVILAGGLGTRLRSMLPDKPKALAEILGRPFLSYLLDQLVQAGLKNIVLCTGYKGDEIYEAMGEKYQSLKLIYCQEEQPLGTGGALRKAVEYFDSDPILVINGDSYINVDLRAYLDWFFEREQEASLLLAKVPDISRFGQVRIGEDNLVKDFEEKGVHQGPGWINAGVYLFKVRVLLSITEGKFFSLEQELFPKLANMKILYGYFCGEEFLDIGTPESFSSAEHFFKNRRESNKEST